MATTNVHHQATLPSLKLIHEHYIEENTGSVLRLKERKVLTNLLKLKT